MVAVIEDNKTVQRARAALNAVHRAGSDLRAAWLKYGAALNELRSQYPSDEYFGQQVAAHGLIDGVNKTARAAAMWAAANPDQLSMAEEAFPNKGVGTKGGFRGLYECWKELQALNELDASPEPEPEAAMAEHRNRVADVELSVTLPPRGGYYAYRFLFYGKDDAPPVDAAPGVLKSGVTNRDPRERGYDLHYQGPFVVDLVGFWNLEYEQARQLEEHIKLKLRGRQHKHCGSTECYYVTIDELTVLVDTYLREFTVALP